MEGEEKKDKAEAVEILGGSSYQLVCEGQSADDSTSALNRIQAGIIQLTTDGV